jgi:protein-tyrosine phosphatase
MIDRKELQMTEDLDARRHLELEGTVNTRDIGGYETRDGRHTKWGMLLRSDSLHQLSPASQQALVDYGLRSVLDLRKSQEMQKTRNVFLGSDLVDYYHQNMVGDTLMREREHIPEELDYVEHMRWSYSVVLDRRKSHVQDTLSLLARPGTLPSLVHCAGGTERTGLIIGLVLSIVGVPEETIAEDFALTARFSYAAHLEKHPEHSADSYTMEDHQAKVCRPDTMLAVLRTLQERYCGAIGYARDIGVSEEEMEALRDALLE